MPSTPQRLSEADANFVVMGAATDALYVPVAITVYERPFPDDVVDHLNEVMSRLLPAMGKRIVRDPVSPALHRWADVPGFDPSDHIVVLPAPGDGSLRAVLDWAETWSRVPLPLDRPPWRAVYFEDVTVEGVPGRMVAVTQFHHAVIDGQGAQRLAEHFYQWAPDGSLPEMPPPLAPDESTALERWREGWALEGRKAAELVRNTGRRLRWAASDRAGGLTRAKELAAAAKRLGDAQGTTTLSPLLRRSSDRNRFDHLEVDLGALRAGARTVGGSANDGFMAGMSLGLQRWHVDHGIKVPAVRTAMAISTRTAEQGHHGNELIGAILRLPLLESAEHAVKECGAVSRQHRDDRDVLWLMDRFRAAGNRLPKPVISRLWGPSVQGIDLSLSNVKGMPLRSWIAGVEALDTVAFLIGGPAVAATLVSGPERSMLGIVTCPEAIADPEHLLARIAEGLAEVEALAG